MSAALITDAERKLMLHYGDRSANGEDLDPPPVVKIFTPDASCTWLLTELDPDDTDIAFGLCDLGLGFPELGSVRISELRTVRGALGLPVERDRHFSAKGKLSAYSDAARKAGHITDDIQLPSHKAIRLIERGQS